MREHLKKHLPKSYIGEQGFMDLLKDIVEQGVDIGSADDRTNIGHRKLLNCSLVEDVGTSFPSFTTRLVSPRLGFEEFWAFLNGRADINHVLEPKGIKFWKGNTTREFLDKRGLQHIPEGYMGKGYSAQYRNFGGELNDKFQPDMQTGVDQIKNTLEALKTAPFGRRHLVSIWNPKDEHEMALPPCFYAHQFTVLPDPTGNKELHLKVFSRSCDVLFGNNRQTFAIYLKAVANYLGMKVGLQVIEITDAHIYFNQLDYVQELLTRSVNQPYNVDIPFKLKTFEDFLALTWDDIKSSYYYTNVNVNSSPLTTPRPNMAV